MTLNHSIIQEITLNQTTASVVIPVPTGYSDLRLVMSLRSSNPEGVGVIYFNSDTTNTNYTVRRMLGEGSGTPSSATANYPYIYYMNPSNDTANAYSNHEVYISDYLSSNPKTFLATGARENNGIYGVIAQVPGRWSSTAAINSLTIKPYNEGGASFAAGCTFTLYGITKTGATVTAVPKASGGDIIKNDGTYWYHAFLSTGAFIPQTTLSCDYLVVAGGGGGGWNLGGGGGAGGLVYATSQAIPSTSQTISVGAGGSAGLLGSGTQATAGGNSTIGSLVTAYGGGRGGSSSSTDAVRIGGNGGSGGGADGYGIASGTTTITAGGTGTAGQGNNGGAAYGNNQAPYGNGNTGGGGGAGAVGGTGSNGSPWQGGNGGDGLYYDAFGSATGTGDYTSSHYYYAGGGGGASLSSGSRPIGGKGGGGLGGRDGNETPTAGVINTGGGGGGSRGNNGDGTAGGSGIVIIRYAMA